MFTSTNSHPTADSLCRVISVKNSDKLSKKLQDLPNVLVAVDSLFIDRVKTRDRVRTYVMIPDQSLEEKQQVMQENTINGLVKKPDSRKDKINGLVKELESHRNQIKELEKKNQFLMESNQKLMGLVIDGYSSSEDNQSPNVSADLLLKNHPVPAFAVK